MFKLNFHLTKAALLYAKKKTSCPEKKIIAKSEPPNRSNFPSLILWEVMKISESGVWLQADGKFLRACQ